ncbi:GtrA family protein (fragment) [metagenome]|uniref:GtrA family protein n=1 Tax=metagenome TaxID=256318 RepID=A0A2P2C510_9ZZZZ
MDRRRRLDEVARFLAVGGVATLVALFLFNLLVHGNWAVSEPPLRDHAVLAYVLANSVGMVVSYRGSRHWAFKHRETTYADGGRTAYILINLATMSLPVGCLWFSRTVLGLDDPWADNLSANVIGLSLGMVARFYLFRTVVFSQLRDAAPPGVRTPPSPVTPRTRTP